MKSKAAAATRRTRIERELALTPAERVALAFELGRRDAEVRARATGKTVEEAAAELAAERRRGRKFSRCAER